MVKVEGSKKKVGGVKTFFFELITNDYHRLLSPHSSWDRYMVDVPTFCNSLPCLFRDSGISLLLILFNQVRTLAYIVLRVLTPLRPKIIGMPIIYHIHEIQFVLQNMLNYVMGSCVRSSNYELFTNNKKRQLEGSDGTSINSCFISLS